MSDTGAEDMRRLSHDLTRVGVAGVIRADSAMRKALLDINARAKVQAPVRFGYLRDSISTEVSREGGTIRGEVGPTANYGRFVEEGTIQNRAQPYLRPATDAVLPSYEAALGQILDGLV